MKISKKDLKSLLRDAYITGGRYYMKVLCCEKIGETMDFDSFYDEVVKKLNICDKTSPKIQSSKIDERLKEAIKKAKPNMDKIKDVDKFLDDIR